MGERVRKGRVTQGTIRNVYGPCTDGPETWSVREVDLTRRVSGGIPFKGVTGYKKERIHKGIMNSKRLFENE